MPREFFAPTAMSADSKALVVKMIQILDDYQAQGYTLTLRQTYYQLVSRNVIPNTEQSYKRVGSILNDARMCGYVDWDMIVDRDRETTENNHWDSPKDILTASARQFRYDLWDDQPWHVEVMVEKKALEGILEPVCQRFDIPFTANKGYSSSSAMHQAGKRIQERMDAGKNICVLYLGDHDPSGIDMTRDIEDRLKLFCQYDFFGAKKRNDKQYEDDAFRTMNTRKFQRYKNAAYNEIEFVVNRVALNMDQVRQYDPPPNPTKLTDSRSQGYVEEYGDESWELDALEPTVLVDLVTFAIQDKRDDGLWDAAVERQEEARDKLLSLVTEFD